MELASPPKQDLRFGQVIEINPLGIEKICSYDCVYCNLGPSEVRMNQVKKDIEFPAVDAIEMAARERILEAVSSSTKIDHLVVSGNGEPSLHPDLDVLSKQLIAMRDEALPEARLLILTNGAHIDTRRTTEALDMFDERIIKLDAGSENGFKRVNSPLIRGNISKVTSGARKLKDCVVQSLFFSGKNSNLNNDELDEWMEVVGIIKPKLIQIYTIEAGSRPEMGIERASEDELYTIASKFKRKSNIELKVFYE